MRRVYAPRDVTSLNMHPRWTLLGVVTGILWAASGLPIALASLALLALRQPLAAGAAILAWGQATGVLMPLDVRSWTAPPWGDGLQTQALALLKAGHSWSDGRLLGGMLLGRSAAGFGLSAYPHWLNAGMAHLLVASGAQVTLLVYPLIIVLHRSSLSPRWRKRVALVILAQIALVLALTGLEPSILRAATLAGWMLGGLLLDRPVQPDVGLCQTASGWLLLDPLLLTDVGFQLSYAATWGLIRIGPRIEAWLLNRLPPARIRPLEWLLTLASATWGAQIAVFPVLWAIFGRLEVRGFLSNLVAVPLSEIVILTGAGKLLLAAVGFPGGWLDAILRLLLTWLDAIATVFGSAPAFGAPVPLPGAVAVACIGVLLYWPELRRLPSREQPAPAPLVGGWEVIREGRASQLV